jgi:hypothetical protein
VVGARELLASAVARQRGRAGDVDRKRRTASVDAGRFVPPCEPDQHGAALAEVAGRPVLVRRPIIAGISADPSRNPQQGGAPDGRFWILRVPGSLPKPHSAWSTFWSSHEPRQIASSGNPRSSALRARGWLIPTAVCISPRILLWVYSASLATLADFIERCARLGAML